MTAQNITLIGCGKMGAALLKGWLDADIEASYLVIDPHTLPEEFSEDNITHHKSAKEASELLQKSDIIILAVKPQLMQSICTNLAPLIRKNALILSIAAGQSISSFETYLGATQPIIRAMPNTPASIGKGVSVAVANSCATTGQRALAGTLLRCSGMCEWVEDEALLNAVTAVSGSGPAYIFYLIEVMTQAAQNAGLEPELAEKLARQTIIGSAALAEASPELSASTLRQNVTSPNGTTQAALDVLMNGEMQNIFDKALLSAKKRGEELNHCAPAAPTTCETSRQ